MKTKTPIYHHTFAFAYVLLVVFFSSCSGEKLEHKVVLSKSNENFFNNPLPDGWNLNRSTEVVFIFFCALAKINLKN